MYAIPLAISNKIKIWVVTLILTFPLLGNSSTSATLQDSISLHVKSKLSLASKTAKSNIHQALEITDELLENKQLQSRDSIASYVKYRHSLYLLLADKNKESQEVINEILPYYKSAELKKWVILQIRLGSINIRTGNFDIAKKYLEEAIPICDKLDMQLNKGIAKVYLADIHLLRSEYRLAFQCVDQALTIFQSLERNDWITSALTDLAYICIRAKDYTAAEEYFVQIEKIQPEIKNKSFLVRPNLFQGILNYQLGNYAAAKTQLENGILEISNIGTFPDLPIIFQYLAKISLKNKEYENANEYIKSAIEYAERSNNKHFKHSANLVKIEAQKILHPETDCLKEALEIYDWASKNQDIELIEKSSLLISDNYEKIGEYKNALTYRDVYAKALSKSINTDKYNQISLLNEKNKFQQEAKEIALREENLQLKVGTDSKIKTILIISLSLVTALLTSLLFLFNKLRKNNFLLGDKIQELKTAETKLGNKNKELQSYIESNIQLEQFAHVASHDLRSPILTINSFASLLKKKATGKLDPNEIKYLDFIESNGKQMLDLVTDLLDYSKLNSQALNLADVEINKLLSEVTNSIKPQAEEKNIQIKTKSDFPLLKADEIKLKRVLQNLVSNSIKFADPKRDSHIDISCIENNTNYSFEVKDNGIGIKNNIQDIFQPYVQLNLKSDYKGTGLGLSVCKKIIEQHGGTIDYQGEEGKGATFSFSIAKDIKRHEM